LKDYQKDGGRRAECGVRIFGWAISAMGAARGVTGRCCLAYLHHQGRCVFERQENVKETRAAWKSSLGEKNANEKCVKGHTRVTQSTIALHSRVNLVGRKKWSILWGGKLRKGLPARKGREKKSWLWRGRRKKGAIGKDENWKERNGALDIEEVKQAQPGVIRSGGEQCVAKRRIWELLSRERSEGGECSYKKRKDASQLDQ